MTAIDICFGCLTSILHSSGDSIRFSSKELSCPYPGYRIQMALNMPPHTSSLIPQSTAQSHPTQNHDDWFIDWPITQIWPSPITFRTVVQNNIRYSFSTWITKVIEYKFGFPNSHPFAIV